MPELLGVDRPLAAVLVSLVASGLIRLFGQRPALRESCTFGAGVVKLALVASMLPVVLGGGVVESAPLSLLPGVTLHLRVDPLGLLFALVASTLWLLTSIYSVGYMRSGGYENQTGYFASFAVCVSATIGLAFAANLLTFFVFYEMLTGELPIGRFEPPSKKVRVDVRLDDVVLRTLEAVPDRRYQHASDVKTEVETIINDGTGRPVVPSAPPVIMSSVRDRLKVPAVGLAVASAVDILVTLAIVLASLRIPGAPAEGLVVSVRTLMFSTIGVSSFVHGALLALGATSMFSLRSYRIAVAAAVVAILPFGPASPISLPFGIWALILLSKGDVQAAFNTPSR